VRHITGMPRDREFSAQGTDQAIGAEVTSKARCADASLDPDAWFPISIDVEAARREAAGAIAICADCPVRDACLELSLRQWRIGQHGVWGGLVPAERAALRRRWLASPHSMGRVPSILDRIPDGLQLARHAGGGGRPPAAVALQVPRHAYGQRAVGVAAVGQKGDHRERDTRPSA
jgi:WhiB family redox-sensing transcriptional regulator